MNYQEWHLVLGGNRLTGIAIHLLHSNSFSLDFVDNVQGQSLLTLILKAGLERMSIKLVTTATKSSVELQNVVENIYKYHTSTQVWMKASVKNFWTTTLSVSHI